MTDKTVKELAQISKKEVSLLQSQLKEAGLPARGDDALVTESEQEILLAFLKKIKANPPKANALA